MMSDALIMWLMMSDALIMWLMMSDALIMYNDEWCTNNV